MKSHLHFVTFFFCALGAHQIGAQQNLPEKKVIPRIQDLCWSPDEKTIYFSGIWHKPDFSDFKQENWAVYKYSFETKTLEKLIDSAYYVAVSSSGKKIVTGKVVKGNRDVYTYDQEGKNSWRITSHPKGDYMASFSPDGRKIVFNSMRHGKPDIYVVNSDSTGLKRLTFSSKDTSYYSPQWSPNGKKITFYMGTGNRADQIYVMNADGSNARNITNDSALNFYPAWINNKKIIYTQESNGKKRTFTISANGKDKTLLLETDSFFARVSFKSKMIAYIDPKEQCIKIISSNGELISKILLIQ